MCIISGGFTSGSSGRTVSVALLRLCWRIGGACVGSRVCAAVTCGTFGRFVRAQGGAREGRLIAGVTAFLWGRSIGCLAAIGAVIYGPILSGVEGRGTRVLKYR